MMDEHTRQSVLNIVDRSIPAEDLVAALEKAFALWGGPPQVLRCDNGPEFIADALRTFCEDRLGIGYVPPGQPARTGAVAGSTACGVVDPGDRVGDATRTVDDQPRTQAQHRLGEGIYASYCASAVGGASGQAAAGEAGFQCRASFLCAGATGEKAVAATERGTDLAAHSVDKLMAVEKSLDWHTPAERLSALLEVS